jgi:hypothetical protein
MVTVLQNPVAYKKIFIENRISLRKVERKAD